jgi:putative spermidine/putrescine transport system ATP-binding protein
MNPLNQYQPLSPPKAVPESLPSGQISFPPRELSQPQDVPKLKAAIVLQNVSKSFSGRQVLKPINLSVNEGEKVVLLGPSGCGKTTTLRLIAGLETAESGSAIYLGDRDITHLAPEKREISLMFQNYALFPHLNVTDNVAYGLKVRKVPKPERQQRVEELLTLTRLTDHAQRNVLSLSGGQRQRVALARALATRPKVLLLDEPLAALDAALRVKVREEMDELLSAFGITSVIVTHDQDEAMSLGDKIVVMRDGDIEQIGSPQQIYHFPITSFVAGFVGGANRLRARVSGSQVIFDGDVSLPLTEAGKQYFSYLNSSDLPVAVYIRPEKARLTEAGRNCLWGKVISSRCLGSITRVVILLASDERIKLELPGICYLSPGSSVGVDLPVENLFIFPDTTN